MLLMYNYVLLKMSTWYSKHVEESNNIWWINNIQCITLVVLYGQFMMHGQRNIELSDQFSPCLPFHFLNIHFNILLSSCICLLSGSSPRFLHQNPVCTPLSPLGATCPPHLFVNWITRIIFGEKYRLQSCSLCSVLHSPVTSSLLRPN